MPRVLKVVEIFAGRFRFMKIFGISMGDRHSYDLRNVDDWGGRMQPSIPFLKHQAQPSVHTVLSTLPIFLELFDVALLRRRIPQRVEGSGGELISINTSQHQHMQQHLLRARVLV